MTIQTQRALLAMMAHKWATCTHGEVYAEASGRDTIYFTVFGIQHYQVFLSVVIGPRGGMKERTLIVDPTQPVQLEQLVASYIGYDGLLNLKAMRSEVTDAGAMADVCRRHLGNRVRCAVDASPHSLAEVRRLELFCREELHFVQGGAPGLGR